MKQKFFHIPVINAAQVEAELNSFCDQQSVSHIEKHFVADGQNSFWAICVTWSGNSGSLVSSQSRKGKVDYKEVLNEVDFRLYCKLRELRKVTADQEGVAIYNIFTNDQLATMVQKRITTKTVLEKVQGVGKARIDKYAATFLDCLCSSLEDENNETTTHNT